MCIRDSLDAVLHRRGRGCRGDGYSPARQGARDARVADHPAHLFDEVLGQGHVAPEVRGQDRQRGTVLLDGESELGEDGGDLGRVDRNPEQVAREACRQLDRPQFGERSRPCVDHPAELSLIHI